MGALCDVAEVAIESSRPAIEASGNALKLTLPEEPVWLHADPTRLAQVVGNLLTNSAKYTPSGGRIELAATLESGEVVIRVADNGLGIPPGMLTDVFEMFTQVNRSLDRSQGGLGIGLALVKRLIALHGGAITAFSRGLGQGSTFTVRIPKVDAGSEGPERRPGPDAALAQTPSCLRRVLVVDDNVDGAESLMTLLKMRGHEARCAHTGPDALNAARSFRPEAVLLDIGLPGMNGYEVAKCFRREPSLSGALLIAITGWGSEENKQRSSEAGFDFHLTKPVEVTDIESILARGARSGSSFGPEPVTT